jgi:phospholipid N-methyltransferase
MPVSTARRKSRIPGLAALLRLPPVLFLRGFLKAPAMVGSIVPSSQRLIARILAPVDWGRVRLFVEYGPGVGTFTRPILDRLPADAVLVAIDPNPDFIDYLKREIVDPRLCLVRGSAADVEQIIADLGHDAADYIVSGLPFSTLPEGVAARIATATAAVLRPGGAFLVYQFSGKALRWLAPAFPRIDRSLELWNVPPGFCFFGWKD